MSFYPSFLIHILFAIICFTHIENLISISAANACFLMSSLQIMMSTSIRCCVRSINLVTFELTTVRLNTNICQLLSNYYIFFALTISFSEAPSALYNYRGERKAMKGSVLMCLYQSNEERFEKRWL